MLILASTTDKLQLVTDQAVNVDVHCSYVDISSTDFITISAIANQNTAISTATTTDILAAPGSNVRRNAKTINIRNKSTTTAVTVTAVFDANGTDYELHKVLLQPGDALEYIEGVGWFTISPTKTDVILRVAGSNYVNATTSFTDITGLTYPIKNGKHYNFLAMLTHVNDAATTGSRFAINGPTATTFRASEVQVVTTSVTSATFGAGAQTTLDTAIIATTSGSTSVRSTIIHGYYNPSADGTFAVRGASEVAVAAGLTVHVGSFCRLWEA